jgi:hypothetical protein
VLVVGKDNFIPNGLYSVISQTKGNWKAGSGAIFNPDSSTVPKMQTNIPLP